MHPQPMPSYQLVTSDDPALIKWPSDKFKCLVLIERVISAAFRDAVSRDLVQNGCLYMMAWGLDCSLWDDAVDFAHLEQWEFQNSPDDQFVMTTWHDRETMAGVLSFAKIDARVSYAGETLDDLLILDISTVDRSELIKDLYARIE